MLDKLNRSITCIYFSLSFLVCHNLVLLKSWRYRLNQARIKTEKIIDILYKLIKSKFDKKPITHRQTARKECLKVGKKRRATCREIRKAIKKN